MADSVDGLTVQGLNQGLSHDVEGFGVGGNLGGADVLDQALSDDLVLFAGSGGVTHLVLHR